MIYCLQCFDAVGWAAGRASGPEWWGADVVICLERGSDLHMAQRIPLPLTVSCFSEIQIVFTFLVPAHRVVPDKGPFNVCVCVSLICCQVCTRVSPAGRQTARRRCVPCRRAAASTTAAVRCAWSRRSFTKTGFTVRCTPAPRASPTLMMTTVKDCASRLSEVEQQPPVPFYSHYTGQPI